jgi:hypothetical protein
MQQYDAREDYMMYDDDAPASHLGAGALWCQTNPQAAADEIDSLRAQLDKFTNNKPVACVRKSDLERINANGDAGDLVYMFKGEAPFTDWTQLYLLPE